MVMVERKAFRPVISLLRLQSFPILQQLLLEERFLRSTGDNMCIINDGTEPPSIVMGISGKPHALLELSQVMHDRIPVIKRFTGGGTVIVDGGTVFVTLICSREAIPGLQLFPRHIMSWTEQLYGPVFQKFPGFQLREHDYVFRDQKFGGNAQAIIKDRWLHHTSFLWDYEDSRMACLKIPGRAPNYRLGRSHGDFICRLKDYLPSRAFFLESIVNVLEHNFFVEELTLEDVCCQDPAVKHVSSTKLLTDDELTECLETSADLVVDA